MILELFIVPFITLGAGVWVGYRLGYNDGQGYAEDVINKSIEKCSLQKPVK